MEDILNPSFILLCYNYVSVRRIKKYFQFQSLNNILWKGNNLFSCLSILDSVTENIWLRMPWEFNLPNHVIFVITYFYMFSFTFLCVCLCACKCLCVCILSHSLVWPKSDSTPSLPSQFWVWKHTSPGMH